MASSDSDSGGDESGTSKSRKEPAGSSVEEPTRDAQLRKQGAPQPGTSAPRKTGTSASSSPSTKKQGAPKQRRYKNQTCLQCGLKLDTRYQLNTHLRVHTGEKPFVCKFAGCDSAFARNEELTRHVKTHTDERPHECIVCKMRFRRSDHRNKHLLRIHGTSE